MSGVGRVDEQRCSGRGPWRASAGCASSCCWCARRAGRSPPAPRGSASSSASGARQVGEQHLRCEFDLAAGRAQHFGHSGLQRAEVDAARRGADPGEVEAVGLQAETSPYGPPRSARSSSRSGPLDARDGGHHCRRVLARELAHVGLDKFVVERLHVGLRAAPQSDRGQAQQVLPLRRVACGRREHRRRCSARGCGTRAAGTRRRSGCPAAGSSRAGSRRRGAWSR